MNTVQFANPLPWWGWLLAVVIAACVAAYAYSGAPVNLSARRRGGLIALRCGVLLLVVVFLARPVRFIPSRSLQARPLPILVDVSRSMALKNEDGTRRIDQAAQILRRLIPSLPPQLFKIDLLTFGEEVAAGDLSKLVPAARRTDLTGALRAVGDRYRGQSVATIVLSDGGDTGGRDAALDLPTSGAPIFAVGVGDAAPDDREVLSATAGDASVVDSLVDLTVSSVSRGFGHEPFEVRLSANGRLVDAKTVVPRVDGSPITQVFSVAPDRSSPTLFTVEIPASPLEATAANNTRSVLVPPPARRRRLLMLQGAPGFEQSFLGRAWSGDNGLEVDSVVRKTQEDGGPERFYIQASASRTPGLVSGFPADRQQLYAYDGVALANMDPDLLQKDQLAMIRDFVAQRGGGLLVFGARSFEHGGFVGTPLEDVLAMELSEVSENEPAGYAEDAAPVESSPETTPGPVVPTPDGERHPATRLGRTPEETRQRWSALPALASILPLGFPRHGAQILLLSGADADATPLLAVQRYGQGRTMVFGGEASWRWKMLMPATSTAYETFWRQAARWLTAPALDPVVLRETSDAVPGDAVTVEVWVRDAGFAPVADAAVTMTVTSPSREEIAPKVELSDAAAGSYRASLRIDQHGVYGVRVEARKGRAVIGRAQGSILAGGADPEMADPRLNEDVLRRIADATGGRYLPAQRVDTLAELLSAVPLQTAEPERQDLWNRAWTFAVVMLLLTAEWTLRRRWGMR